jgi:hypothetical protein
MTGAGMNYLKILFIAVCLLLLSATTNMAAERGLLLLGSPRQSIDGSYEFTNASFGKTSSHEQLIIENYGFGIDYAVLSPEILSGSLKLNLLASQDQASVSGNNSGSASKLGFLYDIKAEFFNTSVSSLNVVYKSQINDVQSPFEGSYRLNSDIFGANWIIRNKVLPVVFSFSRSISSTDGTPEDSTDSNNDISINVSHMMGISRTNLDLDNTNDHFVLKNGAIDSINRQYKASLRNTIAWNDADRMRSLDSYVTVYESATTNAGSNSTFDLQENLLWDLGKALKSNMSYNYDNSSTDRGRQQSNAVIGMLQHTLYNSLTTQLVANARNYNDNSASESEIDGRVSLAYRKMLPAESTLDLGYYQQYGITDRTQVQGALARRTVLKEPHSVVFGQRILLANPNYVPGSIFVYNASATFRPAILMYTEGVDFRVDTTFPLAEVIVIPGSKLDVDSSSPGGNNLLITYDYQLDNSQRFSTTNQGASASIGLMGGKYRIFAGIDQSKQESLSGTVQSSQLDSHSRINAGFNAKLYKYTLTSQIVKYDSVYDNSRTVDSSLDYSDTVRSGMLALYIRDSYRWYGSDSITTQGPETVVSVGGNYILPSIFYGSMTLRADYAKWISNIDSDRLSVGADLRWTVRKFVVSLQSIYAYTRIGGNLSESESIRLHFTRFF